MNRPAYNVAEIEAAAKAATPGPWFSVGPPWNDRSGYVIAGHHDPHAGRLVCDMAGQRDAETGDDNDAANDWRDADYVAAANPATVLALCAALRDVVNSCEHRNLAKAILDHHGITLATPPAGVAPETETP